MGIFKRKNGGRGAMAAGVLDGTADPAREMAQIIATLEEQQRSAVKDLLGYKTMAKKWENTVAEEKQHALEWEKRAMIAIKNGNDSLAKDCLQRKRQCEAEIRKIEQDRREAAGYAAELNSSRKKVEVKLRMLKLRKGTLASQIVASRSGEGDIFAKSEELFDRMKEVEQDMDHEIFAQQAAMELQQELGETIDGDAIVQRTSSASVLDDPLAQLKAKLALENKTRG